MSATEQGDLAGALATLERFHDLGTARSCLLGVARDIGRWGYVARSRAGDLRGAYLPSASTVTDQAAPEVPSAVLSALAACPEVGVIATAPVLGRSRLLPDDRAWSYLHRSRRPVPTGGALTGERRLVIWDVQPPEALGLQRLLAVPDLAAGPGTAEVIDEVSGPGATPRAVLPRLANADLIEWHVHGVVDPEVSDAAALALSPDEDGRALLTAHEVLAQPLPRHPGVVLGACRAGLSARYGSYQWSLPLAFLRAGARWVIASPTPIEDAEGPAFFAALRRRIAAGASPAIALRDERTSKRWRASYREWTRDVVLFE